MAEVKWATRTIEGLLIGIGASLAFAIFTEMKTASTRLEHATERLQNQEKLNKEIRNLGETNSKDIQVIRQYLDKKTQDMNLTLELLAKKIETLNQATAKTDPTKKNNKWPLGSDWKAPKLEKTKPIPTVESSTSWPVPNSYYPKQIENIDTLINEQNKIKLD